MSAYQIKGVTITSQGSGYYSLTHASLPEPLRVRGKDEAEKRAEQVAEEYANQSATTNSQGHNNQGDDGDDGSMESQGAIDIHAVPPALGTTVGEENPGSHAEVSRLKEELAAERSAREAAQAQAGQQAEENRRMMDELREMMTTMQTRTVEVTGEGPEVPPTTYAPSEYTGTMDDNRKAELKRLGIETTDIILEENETIPPTGLFIGHNGRGYMIKPGEKVTVPDFLLGVLDDALMSAPVVDSGNMKVLGYRSRMRYPYRRV